MPASSAASSEDAVWWSQLAGRPVLPAKQRPHQEVSSGSSVSPVSSRQSRQSVKRERAPFGGSTLAEG